MKVFRKKKGGGGAEIVSCYLSIINGKEFDSVIRELFQMPERDHIVRESTYLCAEKQSDTKGRKKDHSLFFLFIFFNG